MLVAAPCCVACSVVYPEVHVGPDFRVKVPDRGQPVSGLQVEISRERGGAVRAITDKDGFAGFRDVRSGSYLLHADHDVGVWDGTYIDVMPNGPSQMTVLLMWPSIAPVAVRSLKGTLHPPDYLPGQTQPRLSLDLLEGVSGKTLKSGRTTESGAFEFANAVPGIYLLRLKPSGLKDWGGEQITGLIAVAVYPSASGDQLELELGWSSCGLTYTDRGNCPKSELQIEQLRGRIIDSGGAAIAEAEVDLFDSDSTLVEQTRSNSEGEFASAGRLAGVYELVVRYTGFTALRAAVHAGANADELPARSNLSVQLGVAGTCSTVHPR
jgi:hypothetical protein